MKTRLFVVAFLLGVVPFLPRCGVHASIVDYGVYKVEARITGDDTHPSLTKIDSKAPGIWSTDANAIVTDSYGMVTNAWSIHPLTTEEAQVNIAMGYTVAGSGYKYSYAGEEGEVHFNYHSDTPFTVNYYWDLTWDLYPHGYYDLNWFTQYVKLRVYNADDPEGNWWDPIWLPSPPPPQGYAAYGHYTGSTSFDVGAGNWLFIVFDGGSASRWGGEFESLSGYVYLDFDAGSRLPDVDFNHDGSVNLVDFNFFAQTWLLSTGQDGYLEVCDLVNDDVINLSDMVIFLEYWLD